MILEVYLIIGFMTGLTLWLDSSRRRLDNGTKHTSEFFIFILLYTFFYPLLIVWYLISVRNFKKEG